MAKSAIKKDEAGRKYLILIIIVLVAIAIAFSYFALQNMVSMTHSFALAQAQNASLQYNFQANATMMQASSISQCYLQQVAPCNNNEPSQFLCLNKAYKSAAQAQFNALYSNSSRICPLFLEAGSNYCAVVGGYCTVVHSPST